eukprot:Rmarinus@m.18103
MVDPTGLDGDFWNSLLAAGDDTFDDSWRNRGRDDDMSSFIKTEFSPPACSPGRDALSHQMPATSASLYAMTSPHLYTQASAQEPRFVLGTSPMSRDDTYLAQLDGPSHPPSPPPPASSSSHFRRPPHRTSPGDTSSKMHDDSMVDFPRHASRPPDPFDPMSRRLPDPAYMQDERHPPYHPQHSQHSHYPSHPQQFSMEHVPQPSPSYHTHRSPHIQDGRLSEHNVFPRMPPSAARGPPHDAAAGALDPVYPAAHGTPMVFGEDATPGSGDIEGGEGENAAETEEEKRKKRLERNRVMARRCREKRKAYINALEAKVSMLTEEIEKLRREEEESHKRDSRRKQQMTKAFQNLLNNEASDAEIDLLLLEFGKRFAENCDTRLGGVQHHLKEILRLMNPTPRDKFLLWGLSQTDDFYSGNEPTQPGRGGTNMWHMLCRDLELTPEQQSQILGRRNEVALEYDSLVDDVRLVESLRDVIISRLRSTGFIVRDLRHTITPRQAAMFLLWVEKQQASGWMPMVNCVWESAQREGVGWQPHSSSSTGPADRTPANQTPQLQPQPQRRDHTQHHTHARHHDPPLHNHTHARYHDPPLHNVQRNVQHNHNVQHQRQGQHRGGVGQAGSWSPSRGSGEEGVCHAPGAGEDGEAPILACPRILPSAQAVGGRFGGSRDENSSFSVQFAGEPQHTPLPMPGLPAAQSSANPAGTEHPSTPGGVRRTSSGARYNEAVCSTSGSGFDSGRAEVSAKSPVLSSFSSVSSVSMANPKNRQRVEVLRRLAEIPDGALEAHGSGGDSVLLSTGPRVPPALHDAPRAPPGSHDGQKLT